MSNKKKVSNADFVAATRAVNVACKAMALDQGGEFLRMAMNFQIGGGVPESVKPFDMIANGVMIGDVSTCVIGNFFADWLQFLNLFEKDDGHDDLFTAFLMMFGMVSNFRICDFSQGAFVGVYGSFRVALGRCFMSKIARIGGRKSHDEAIELLALGVSNSLRTAEVARILSKGEKTRDEYIKLQYEDVKQAYIQVLRRGGKPNLSSLMLSTYLSPKNGKLIPKDAGLTENDVVNHGKEYYRFRNWLIGDGVHKCRKNKPGAGGARVKRGA